MNSLSAKPTNFLKIVNDNNSSLIEKSSNNKLLESDCKIIPVLKKKTENNKALSMLKRQNAKLSLKITRRNRKSKKRILSSYGKTSTKDILSSTRINNYDYVSGFALSVYQSPISSTNRSNQNRKLNNCEKINDSKIKQEYYYSKFNFNSNKKKTNYPPCCCCKNMYPVYKSQSYEILSSNLNSIGYNTSIINEFHKNEKFNNMGDLFVWYV